MDQPYGVQEVVKPTTFYVPLNLFTLKRLSDEKWASRPFSLGSAGIASRWCRGDCVPEKKMNRIHLSPTTGVCITIRRLCNNYSCNRAYRRSRGSDRRTCRAVLARHCSATPASTAGTDARPRDGSTEREREKRGEDHHQHT